MTRTLIALILIGCFLLVSPPAEAGLFSKKAELLKNDQPMDEVTPGFERKVFAAKEKKRKALTYFWYQPQPPYPEGLKFPLVVVLHDTTGKAQAAKSLVAPAMQTAFPAFVVVPALTATSVWANPTKPIVQNDGKVLSGAWYEAIHDTVALIKTLPAQYPIDKRRIYVIGCAEGGMGAFGAVLHYPELFAAAVPINGAWSPEDSPHMTKTPIWALHGANDDVMPPYLSKDMVSLIHEYGGPVFYSEMPGLKHDCSAKQFYAPQMWDWMFKQARPAPPPSAKSQ